MEAGKQSYTLAEAARLIGVAPITLKRWLLLAKVGEVARDRNGWRIFNNQDIRRIKRFAQKVTPAEGE